MKHGSHHKQGQIPAAQAEQHRHDVDVAKAQMEKPRGNSHVEHFERMQLGANPHDEVLLAMEKAKRRIPL